MKTTIFILSSCPEFYYRTQVKAGVTGYAQFMASTILHMKIRLGWMYIIFKITPS